MPILTPLQGRVNPEQNRLLATSLQQPAMNLFLPVPSFQFPVSSCQFHLTPILDPVQADDAFAPFPSREGA
jgi:hypothetical protein